MEKNRVGAPRLAIPVQTTEIYTRADPTVKLETLEAAIAPKLRAGRFEATDKLIALLNAPTIMRSAEVLHDDSQAIHGAESAE